MKLQTISEGYVYRFMCPGCKEWHTFWCNGKHHTNGHTWSFNMNMDAPTITPSLNISWGKEADPKSGEPEGLPPNNGWSGRCHSVITDGKISFCNDSTHELSGQSNIDLPDV